MNKSPFVMMLTLSFAMLTTSDQPRAEENMALPRAVDLQKQLDIERNAMDRAMEELEIERRRNQECIKVTQQLTPKPMQPVDIEVLQKANESLTVALGLLGIEEDGSENDIDEELFRKSITLARRIVSICRGRQCRGISDDE